MSGTPTADGLLRAERQLQAAQLAGDVAALDRLLDDRLVAIGPDGSRFTKDDDLDGHRSGSSVISELTQDHVEVLVVGTTGVTFFTGRVSGTFKGQPMTARLRYTRTWAHDGQLGWRIVAAHISSTGTPEPAPTRRVQGVTHAWPTGPPGWVRNREGR